MLCLVETLDVLIDVVHAAVILPISHTALGSAMQQLDHEGSGDVSIAEFMRLKPIITIYGHITLDSTPY